MKLIAHRGNIEGTNSSEENRLEYIEDAIDKGYDSEIDLWYDVFDDKMYLGHDSPDYLVDMSWLCEHKENLWIHCKNIEALYKFSSGINKFNYFWHQNDDYTLTSMGYIWTYPSKVYTTKSIVVMPETFIESDLKELLMYNCYGICSDYVGILK